MGLSGGSPDCTNTCPGCGATDCTPATCPAYVGWSPLLAEDDGPIKLVGERVRDAWERPKIGYTSEQYEADRKRRT